MSVPAAEVIPSAAATPAVQPPAASPTPGTGQPSPANQSFWEGWSAPEQKTVRDTIANKNFADPFTLAKSYVELEGQVGGLRTAANLKGYPADKVDPTTGQVTKADENAIKAWNTTMGVPETADKYEIALPSTNPYPQYADYLKNAMLEARVPAAMAAQLSKGYEAATVKMLGELQAREETVAQQKTLELQNSWGAKNAENSALALRGEQWLAKETGMTPDQSKAMRNILGADKYLTTMLKIASGNKEAGFAGDAGNPSGFTGGVSAARAELDQITADRASNKISDFQWRETTSKRVDQLVKILSDGITG